MPPLSLERKDAGTLCLSVEDRQGRGGKGGMRPSKDKSARTVVYTMQAYPHFTAQCHNIPIDPAGT